MFEEATKKGMTDLTVYRVPTGWQASSRWNSSPGWRVHIHRSIEEAIYLALEAKPVVKEDTGEDLV